MKVTPFLFGMALLMSAVGVNERVHASDAPAGDPPLEQQASEQVREATEAFRHTIPGEYQQFLGCVSGPDQGGLEVDIRLRVDPSLTSRHLTDRLKTETEAIWAPYGVRLEWTDDADAAESAANGVALDASLERQFEGRVRMKRPAVLGRVAVGPDASNWRSIRVSSDATERVLAARTTGRPASGIVLDHQLARALGRVLAHEIGHVLLGAVDHDRAGLMRASFRAEELGEPDRTPFRLTCSDVDRLRGRLRALSRDPQLVHQHHSTRLDPEGFRGARRESSVGAACIPMTHQAYERDRRF